MTIEDEKDVFEFCGLLDSAREGEGTKLFLAHLRKSGKLAELSCVLGDRFSASPDELAYVIAAQNVCEKLNVKLSAFFSSPCCYGAHDGYAPSADVVNAATRLIGRLSMGFGSPDRRGWHAFYSDLGTAALDAISKIDELIKLDAAGARVRFDTNVSPSDVLSGKVNYNSRSGRYFVLGGGRR